MISRGGRHGSSPVRFSHATEAIGHGAPVWSPRPSTGVTTLAGAARLGGEAVGLEPWAGMRLEAPGRPDIDITATPCRHGPPFSRLITGDVIGFALRWDGQAHGVVWISGDSVLYDGIREVADRLMIDTAVLHLDGVRVLVSGRVRRTMTGPTGSSCAACCARARDPGPLRGLDALFGTVETRWNARSRDHPTTTVCDGCRSPTVSSCAHDAVRGRRCAGRRQWDADTEVT